MEKLENYTVDELIACEKIIVDKDPKLGFRRNQQHFQAGMELTDIVGNLRFTIFIRQHAEFKHNYSIGLNYKGKLG
jgi:hypothetical protein